MTAQSTTATGDSHATSLPPRRTALLALAAMASIYFFSFFQRSAVPGTVFNEIQTDLQLTAAAVTALGSMFTYVYGGLQLFVGFAADRYGGIKTLLVGGLVMTIGSLLFPLAHGLPALYACRILTAAGSAFMFLALIKELDLLFESRQFTALLGGVIFIGYCGGVTAMLPFERAVAAWGWRHALLLVAVAMAVTLFWAWRYLRRLDHFTPPSHPFSLGPLRTILLNPRNLPLIACSCLNFPIFLTVQTVIGKKFLQDVSGLSSATAASFTTAMFIATAISAPLGGLMPALIGGRRKPLLITANVLQLAALSMLLLGIRAHAPAGLYLAAYILLAASMLSIPIINSTMKEFNRPENVAVAIAVINSLTYVASGAFANLCGVILDRFKGEAQITAAGTIYPQSAYMALFAVLLGVQVLSCCIVPFIQETRGRNISFEGPA